MLRIEYCHIWDAFASFLAIRCLQGLANEHKRQYRNARHIIEYNFYVDDIVKGSNFANRLIQIQYKVTSIWQVY